MEYYEKVYVNASPIIKHYRTDLEIHDRKALENYDGPFLHLTRDSGTFLVKLLPPGSYLWPARDVKIPYLFGHADRSEILESTLCYVDDRRLAEHSLALYGHDGVVDVVSMERAKEIVVNYVRHVKNVWN